jgi:plasmid replication initiation protein
VLSTDQESYFTEEKEQTNPSYGQSNALVKAAYAMPLYCKRLLILGLSKITYREQPDKNDDEAFTFTVTIQDWYTAYGDDGGSNGYDQMKKAALKLQSHAEGDIWFKGALEHEGIRWFSRCAYPVDENKKGQGYVRMTFSREVRPELTGLTKGGFYSAVDLKAIYTMQSTYSVRLFEMCRSFRDTGFLVLTIEEFRRAFRLEDKYTAYTDLRTKVIEPAVKEANNKHVFDKRLRWTVTKKGNKVTHLRFTFPKGLD